MGRGRRRHNESNFHRGKIDGVEEAVQKLRSLGEDILFAAELELAMGVDEIVADAKSRCPVKTGKLRDSIRAVDIADGAEYELSADATNANGIAYGQFVEFSPKINKPFLYPAIDKHWRIIKSNIKIAVQEAVRDKYGYSEA